MPARMKRSWGRLPTCPDVPRNNILACLERSTTNTAGNRVTTVCFPPPSAQLVVYTRQPRSNAMHCRAMLPRWALAVLAVTVSLAVSRHVFAEQGGHAAPKVDFSYAFATPHRITVGRPSASDRTLLDLQPGSLRMAWTYDNLTMPNYPPLAFKTPPTAWSISITPQIDGKPLTHSRWTRLEGVLPGFGERLRRRFR